MPAFAQQQVNYAIHANIIYRFTKYIQWPQNNSNDFVIGVVGETPLYDELKSFVNTKKVGDQRIVIKKYSSRSANFDSQILYISNSESMAIKKIAAKTGNAPVLIVSESSVGSRYSGINFLLSDQHLSLEISKSNIEKRNMQIAAELLQLGTIIN